MVTVGLSTPTISEIVPRSDPTTTWSILPTDPYLFIKPTTFQPSPPSCNDTYQHHTLLYQTLLDLSSHKIELVHNNAIACLFLFS